MLYKKVRHCPINVCAVRAAAKRTHVETAKRNGVLSDELVIGGGVVVFDDEADNGELWDVHVELEVFVPRWVKAFSPG